MIDLNDTIYRLAYLYNSNPAFNVQGLSAHYITYSPENNINQNTCASFIKDLNFTGTPGRSVITGGVAATPPYFGFEDDPDSNGFASVENDEEGGNFPVYSGTIEVTRYEPILHIRTVFTGSNALTNASLHYQRVRAMLALNGYNDMSLIGKTSFVDASIFFEGRYLIRYQSDACYLVYLDVQTAQPYVNSLDELLKAYPNNQFTDLLTQREIEVNLNG